MLNSTIFSGKDENIKTLRKDLQESSIKISKLESESVDMEARYQLEVDQVKQATTELVRFKLNHQKIVKENQEYERTVSSLKSHVQSLEKVSFYSFMALIVTIYQVRYYGISARIF